VRSIQRNLEFDAALSRLVEHIDKLLCEAIGREQAIRHSEGNKYIKLIVTQDGINGRHVWGFVDKSNGDILRAACWTRPAKHARGNIYQPPWDVTWTGPKYLISSRSA